MADELWYFQQFSDFGQMLESGYVAPLPPETVLYRAVYVGEGHEIAARLDQARGRITTHHFYGREDIYLLDPPPRRPTDHLSALCSFTKWRSKRMLKGSVPAGDWPRDTSRSGWAVLSRGSLAIRLGVSRTG